jgi:hypothetical protein
VREKTQTKKEKYFFICENKCQQTFFLYQLVKAVVFGWEWRVRCEFEENVVCVVSAGCVADVKRCFLAIHEKKI